MLISNLWCFSSYLRYFTSILYPKLEFHLIKQLLFMVFLYTISGFFIYIFWLFYIHFLAFLYTFFWLFIYIFLAFHIHLLTFLYIPSSFFTYIFWLFKVLVSRPQCLSFAVTYLMPLCLCSVLYQSTNLPPII